jgi:predicted membrane protein
MGRYEKRNYGDFKVIKSILMGGIPLAIFFYLMMCHPYIILTIVLAAAFIILSWMIGITYREEYGDLSDKRD